jgi:hypothetical protein
MFGVCRVAYFNMQPQQRRKKMKNLAMSIMGFLLVTSTLGCSSVQDRGDSFTYEERLQLKETEVTDIEGVFTLILYNEAVLGDRDIMTIAFIDMEGDQYTFEPNAPDYDYTVQKGLSFSEALEGARHHISDSSSYLRSRLSRIVDREGKTFGYELRPHYQVIAYGYVDVFRMDYRIKNSKVVVTVRLKSGVMKRLRKLNR